jgi:hypothetical protein
MGKLFYQHIMVRYCRKNKQLLVFSLNHANAVMLLLMREHLDDITGKRISE